MTKLDDLKYEVNCAALKAMDEALRKYLGGTCDLVLDRDLPNLLPAIERATEAVLRRTFEGELPDEYELIDPRLSA